MMGMHNAAVPTFLLDVGLRAWEKPGSVLKDAVTTLQNVVIKKF